MRTVLSVQSSVAFGHAGNSAAVFPLQRLGVEVIRVDTVHFSNDTGYETSRGPVHSVDDVRAVIRGVGERGVLADVDAVLCGYLGDPGIAQVVLEAFDEVRAANPGAILCADPVMGDMDTGLYVREPIPRVWRDDVVPAADVLTPNHFELETLVGRRLASLDALVAAAREVRTRGPETVLVTSATGSDLDPAQTHVVAVADEVLLASAPLLEGRFAGAGDLATAVFLANLLRGERLAGALARTVDAVHGVLEATHRAGAREMCLVQEQDLLVHPEPHCTVRRLGS